MRSRDIPAQPAALLVVHLDRVLFPSMFHADAFPPALMGAANFAIKQRVGASPAKTQDLGRGKLFQGVPAQGGIGFPQRLRGVKHHVGGIFPLAHRPVVAAQARTCSRRQPGIDRLRPTVQELGPGQPHQSVQQRLRPHQITDRSKTVVLLFASDSLPLHLSA